MTNVKDEVYDVIKDLCSNVGDSYPKLIGDIPAIEYTEEENKVYDFTDNEEQSSYVRYRFDIWDKVSTSNLSVALDNKVSKLGLKRIQCMDIDDPNGLKHKQLRYEGIVDCETHFVNQL